MNGDRKRVALRAAILCAAALVLLAAGIRLIDDWQQSQYREVRSQDNNEAFQQAGTVEWAGGKYRKIPAVTTLLIAGIDQEKDEQRGVGTSRYRNGGQADFLLLLAIDHTNRQIRQLQIDRDAMTEVTVLSVYGRESGTREMQICLAHSFGANRQENARYTVRAVRGLLNGLEIDGYYMLDYGAVASLNDALGGVTVTVPDDMTAVNPAWEKGSQVTLKGSEAETFVRARKTVGEGTNEERMRRQKEFMEKAVGLLQRKAAQNASFGSRLLSSLRNHAVSSLTVQQLVEEMQSAAGYAVQPVQYLEGEYKIGESGYMEFYAREGSAEAWIMQNLYAKQ